MRGEESLSGKLQAVLAPESDLGIYISEEDFSDEPGVRVGDSMMRHQMGAAFEVPGPGGAAVGMKPGDRLTHLNNIPMLYPEQVLAYEVSTVTRWHPGGGCYTHEGVAKEGIIVLAREIFARLAGHHPGRGRPHGPAQNQKRAAKLRGGRCCAIAAR